MRELKPCPFCGEKEDIDYGIMTGTMRGFDYVQCQNCGAEIHTIHKGKYIDAIKSWNRRAGNVIVTPLLPKKGSNVQPAPPGKIELHKRSYNELSEVLIAKVLETETLYQKMFENCKHRSGWCKKGACKNCQYTK